MDNVVNSHGTLGKFVGGIAPAPGGTNDACGAGNGDDFCIIGKTMAPDGITPISGILLRGEVVDFGAKDSITVSQIFNGLDAVVDDFEFHIQLKGGLLMPNFPTGYLAVLAYGLHPEAFDGTFAANFGDYTDGFLGGTDMFVAPLPPCTGKIAGSVTDYFNPLNGIPGAEVQLTGRPNIIPGPTGSYASDGNLCAGSYDVTVLPPTGYQVTGAGTTTVTLATNSSVVTAINFRLYSVPVDAGSYTTFTQGGWGTKPRGTNAGRVLATYFDLVYSEEARYRDS